MAPVSASLKFQKVIDAYLVTTVMVYCHKGGPGDGPLVASADGYAIAVGYCGRGKWVEYCFRFKLAANRMAIDSFWRGSTVDPASWTDACNGEDGELKPLEESIELDSQDRSILGRLVAELHTIATFDQGMWRVWDDVAKALSPGDYHSEHPSEVLIPHELLRYSGIADQPSPETKAILWARAGKAKAQAPIKPLDPGTGLLPIVKKGERRGPWADENYSSAPESYGDADEDWEGSENLEFREVTVEPEEEEEDVSDDETMEFRVDPFRTNK
jgi:hypothetical protein